MSERSPLRSDMSQMVFALANSCGLTPSSAFQEIFDNGFDANATTIVVKYVRSKGLLTVTDDGSGTDDVESVITPYRHKRHASTISGRYGIGGTCAQIYLINGKGSVEVLSTTARNHSRAVIDYASPADSGDLMANVTHITNEGKPTGTRIKMNGCREITGAQMGSAASHLSFLFTPALRRGKKIICDIDGKKREWQPHTPPARICRKPLSFSVDGHKVKGFCDLVKPGEPNRAKGWTISHGHRFIGTFTDPAGDSAVDLSRIYGEIELPPAWSNINTLKNGFVDPPYELFRMIGEQSAPILNRAWQEDQSAEIDAATRAAQEILDRAMGYEGSGVKGRRPGKAGKSGTVLPTGNGSPHRNFSMTQPDDKRNGVRIPHQRILINWVGDMETSYSVNAETTRARVSLHKNWPSNQKYRSENAGAFLAEHVIFAVASDWKARPKHYLSLFPECEASDIPVLFDQLMAKAEAAAKASVA